MCVCASVCIILYACKHIDIKIKCSTWYYELGGTYIMRNKTERFYKP